MPITELRPRIDRLIVDLAIRRNHTEYNHPLQLVHPCCFTVFKSMLWCFSTFYHGSLLGDASTEIVQLEFGKRSWTGSIQQAPRSQLVPERLALLAKIEYPESGFGPRLQVRSMGLQ